MNKTELLEKLTKSIKIVKERNSKGVVSYKLKLELDGGFETKIPMVNEEIELINVLKFVGHEEPIKSMKLVEEISKETNETYLCVRIDLADESVIRKFLPNNESGYKFKAVIDKLCEFTLSKMKEKDKEVKQNK